MNDVETFFVTYVGLILAFYAGVVLVLAIQRRRVRRHAAWCSGEERRSTESWDAFYAGVGRRLADEAAAWLDEQRSEA